MFQGHWSQRPALQHPDPKLILTGAEFELGKYINDIRAEHDYVMRGLIPRYRFIGHDIDSQPEYYVLAEYVKEVKGVRKLVLDVIETPNIRSCHSKFGFDLHKTDAFKSLEHNKPIPKGTVLGKTASLADDGSYMYGLNANVAFLSLPDVAEDTFVASRSFAERIGITCVEKRIINVKRDTIPLNLYSKNGSYQPLPNIGETVRPDGLLFCHRNKNAYFNPVDLRDDKLCKPDYTFDTPVYVKPGSKVVDIRVIKGNYRRPEFPTRVTEQFDFYASNLITFYKTLKEQVDTVVNSRRSTFADEASYNLSPRLSRLLVEAEFMINSTDPKNKIKLVYKKLPVEEYRIEVTTRVVLIGSMGHKLTDTVGGKGVVSCIREDADMPVDEFGVRADLIVDPNSTLARQNPGRLYEAYLGAFCRDNHKRLTDSMLNSVSFNYGKVRVTDLKNTMTDADYQYCANYLHGMYSLISDVMTKFIPSLTPDEVKQHVVEALESQICIRYTSDDVRRFDTLEPLIEATPYKPNYGRLTLKDSFGNEVTTVGKSRIGVLYIMVLEKIADTYMGVSSAHLNNFGFPAKVSPGDKHKTSHAITPAKTLGETEVRLFGSNLSVVAMAEFIDSVANLFTHKLLVKSVLEADNPMRIPNIDRVANPYGNTKALMILKHITNASGGDFVYVKEQLDRYKAEKGQ